MQEFLYSIFLFFYQLGIRIASPFNRKARELRFGRKRSWQSLAVISNDPAPKIWIHCASLGEFEQGRPVIEKLRPLYPGHRIILTFFSPSGYGVRKNYEGADHVLYLPHDSVRNARKWVNMLSPSLAIFVKYEFWHFYLKELDSRNIRILSISSIFRPEQIYFKSYGGFYRNILQRIDHFFVQDNISLRLLNSIGIEQATVAGDTRFDRVIEIRDARTDIPEIPLFKGSAPLLVAGSVWPEDMEVLIPFINTHDLKFIIAPHEIQDKFMERIEREVEKECVRFSALTTENVPQADVLIIDNVGMLSSLYAYASYAWVGGAYGKGLHNILEAAVYGCPVFFGNRNYEKFREARDLINLGGAIAVENYMELREQFANFSDEKTYTITHQINAEYIESNRGATRKIVNYCQKLLG